MRESGSQGVRESGSGMTLGGHGCVCVWVWVDEGMNGCLHAQCGWVWTGAHVDR